MSVREEQIQGVKDALECGGGLVTFKPTTDAETTEFYARIAHGVEVFDGQYSKVVSTLRALKSDLSGVNSASTFVDQEDELKYKFLEVLRSDGVAMQIVIRGISAEA